MSSLECLLKVEENHALVACLHLEKEREIRDYALFYAGCLSYFQAFIYTSLSIVVAMARPSSLSFTPSKAISEKTKELTQLQQQYKALKASFEEAYSRVISMSGDSSLMNGGQVESPGCMSPKGSAGSEDGREISSEATISKLLCRGCPGHFPAICVYTDFSGY
jgi:hypothetical protein